MRRWFLSRFYRLGLGRWFDPPTRYVDKAPADTLVLGDEIEPDVLESDLVFQTSPLADAMQPTAGVGDDLLGSSPVGVPLFQNEVDP